LQTQIEANSLTRFISHLNYHQILDFISQYISFVFFVFAQQSMLFLYLCFANVNRKKCL